LAETAKKVIQADLSLNGNNKSKRKRGRQPKADSEAKVAERIGVAQPTLNIAKQHVAAVERYPELKEIIHTQKDVLTVSKNLDKLPEGEREKAQKPLR
jgi:hypothetical protein